MMNAVQEFLQFYLDNGSLFLGGFGITVILCVLGTMGSIVLGFVIYLLSTIPGWLVRKVYDTYLNCVRGTPHRC